MNKPLLIFLGLLVATFCNAQPSSGSGPTGGGGGGSTSPGGSSGQIQYNAASSFGGATNIIYGATGLVGIGADATTPATTLHLNQSTAGSDTELRIQQGDNTTATSDARLRIINGGSSGGDSILEFTLTGENQYTIGADNTDNAVKLSPSATVGASPIWQASSSFFAATNNASGNGIHINGTDIDFFGSLSLQGNANFTGEVILNGDIQIRPAAITSTNLNWAAEVESITLSGNTALNVGTPDASGDVTVLWVTGGGSDYVLTLSSNIVDISNDQTITAGSSITVSANQNLVLGFSYDAATTIRVTGLPDVTPYNGVFTEALGSTHTVSLSQLTGEGYGSVHYVTSAVTITLPAVSSGASFTFISTGANVVTIDSNASDLIILDGTVLDDGDSIDSPGAAGDLVTLTYYDGTGWFASSNGWSDGGP